MAFGLSTSSCCGVFLWLTIPYTSPSMASVEEIREARMAKLATLEEKNIDAYPARVERSHSLFDVKGHFAELEKDGAEISVVGRIMSMRGQGALVFIDLFDGTETVQALLKSDNAISYKGADIDASFELFKAAVDQGDFVEVSGTLFESKRGEQTVEVNAWKMVAKSLRAIPDEHYGLKDEDERYRKRYIDILLNKETRERIVKRSIFWNTIRTFLLDRGFVEVETPVLENTPGGAEARPFVTHHNALDMDVYLRISAGELHQKKLMVAGLERTFEIGRIFRNEGMSHSHAQDYTQVEFYQAFSDYKKGMDMVRDLYIEVAKKTFGTTSFSVGGQEIDLANEWETYDFVALIKENTGIDVFTAKLPELTSKLEELSIEFNPKEINKERAVDLLWKSFRKEIVGPGFLVNVPVFMEPLAKKSEDNPETVERFQVILAGSEMGKGFSELNNPIDQTERFDYQEQLRQGGDEEAQMKDDEYVEAMEYGMPPAFGFGVSERLFSYLADVSIREAQIFPLMRPKE